jgi:putative transposase
MEVVLQAESRTLELAFLRQADHDDKILEVWDQPPTIQLHYLSRGGRPIVADHTPDFFVLWQDHAGWIECKPLEKLVALSQSQPHRYRQNDAGEWICPPGIAYARQYGLTYTVVTEENLDPILVRNFEYLDDYYRRWATPPDLAPDTVARILAAVSDEPGISKRRLAQLESPFDMDILHWLIVLGKIYVDLRRCPLADDEYVHVYRDSDQAQIYELCAPSARPAWFTGVEPLQYEPGTPLLWDGKPWLMTNVGETHVYLQLQDGSRETAVVVPKAQLRDLYLGGHISTVHVDTNASSEMGHGMGRDGTSEANSPQRLLSGASPKELRRALARYHYLRRYEAGDMTVLTEVAISSLYRFQQRWRASESGGRPGFLGLLDHSAHSGRGSQISEEGRDLLNTSVRDDYSVKQQPSVGAAYRTYLGRCVKAGADPVSYETYRRKVRAASGAKQTRGRRGPRAAYAETPFTALAHGNRHGEYPLQRVHCDHTQIDLEVVSPMGDRLGRPWLTVWFDAYSRRVLAFYLTFDPPSYRSCMVVVRECVRRNGRLPMTLILDNGREFHSVYFETLLARYAVTVEWRPEAKPRFGAVIERMFGTSNSEFFHALRGNTQIMRRVREVTQSVDPRGQAVWTLPALYDALSEWCYAIYDQTPHTGLHRRTPRAVFLAGQAMAGARHSGDFRYDQEFIRETSPSTPKGTVCVSANRTVKVNYILYAIPPSAGDLPKGTNLPVRYDPENLGHIWVAVKDRPVECFANNLDVFWHRTEREIALVSEELRALDRQAGRTPAVTHSRLVEFIGHIQDHETILLQHLRDQEVRRAVAGNSASFGWLGETDNAPLPVAFPSSSVEVMGVNSVGDTSAGTRLQATAATATTDGTPEVTTDVSPPEGDTTGDTSNAHKPPFTFDDSDFSEVFWDLTENARRPR